MNIACIACPARYAISDEKIVGRKVRIGCKRCGTKLIIDGTAEPPTVRADTGVSSMPPPVRYHLAISHDQRERGDLKRVVELYGRGAILPNTLAWREGMPQWLPLFEVEEIEKALREAGYSPKQAGAPSYNEDEIETRAGGGYTEDEEETHVAKSPREDSEPPRQKPLPRFDDDDDDDDAATSVFDSEALQKSAGAAWSEPASWRESRRQPLAGGEWHERGQSPLPPRSSRKPPGAWAERGLEDDELTHMVAPLSERPEHRPEGERPQPRPSGPGLELRRPKSLAPAVPLTSQQVRPAATASARPPSLPPEERMTGQRSDDSVLFTLDRLSKQRPAPPPAAERAELDFSDVPKLSLGPSVPASMASRDLALLAPPPAKPKARPPAPPPAPAPAAPVPAPRLDDIAEPAPRRSSRKWLLLALLLVIGAGLGGLYATGRWPLVVKTAMNLWQRVQNVR